MTDKKQNINLQRAVYYIFLFGIFLYLASTLKSILAPLVLSIILALVILPIVNWLERRGFNRLFSGLTTVSLIGLILLSIGFVGVLQLRDLGSSAGKIEKVMMEKINSVANSLPSQIRPPTLNDIEDFSMVLPEDLSVLSNFFGDALKATGEVFTTLTLIPIFVFFILFYRGRISRFLEWIDSNGSGDLKLATKESKHMVQNYLSGLGLVLLINATLSATGLWAIGISYALLLGIISALLSIIPYVGTFLGALIPVAFAFLTKDSIFYGLGVMALYAVIQFVENNFTSPIILGNSVNVNPFASILALLVMGHFWGVMGMVMAVPITAVLVIIIDHSESLKSINLLLKNDE